MQNSNSHPLATYLQRNNLNYNQAGQLFGCDGTTVARIIADGRAPGNALMQRIIDRTGGQLLPNDFYQLPEAQDSAAPAAADAAE